MSVFWSHRRHNPGIPTTGWEMKPGVTQNAVTKQHVATGRLVDSRERPLDGRNLPWTDIDPSRPSGRALNASRLRASIAGRESWTNVARIVETMSDPLSTLRSSVDRLAAVVRLLDEVAITDRAYPSEWTIADVLSHLGSGAVIAQRRLDDALAGSPTPDDFNPGVWDEWNAKAPRTKVDDGLAADGAFVARLEAVAPGERDRFKTPMGPLELDWDAFVGMRLNEHLLHEWDVMVSVDPAATLAADGTALVVDNLELIGRFTAKPNGDPRTITVGTTDPHRSFAVTIEPGTITFAPASSAEQPDLSMPAESFVRLVYGRLDPDHTPRSVVGDAAALHQLRAVFPGP
jgi:uncharacterized protein (TIGR03083 family)